MTAGVGRVILGSAFQEKKVSSMAEVVDGTSEPQSMRGDPTSAEACGEVISDAWGSRRTTKVGRLARTYCAVVGHTGDWTYPDERCVRVRTCERCGEVTRKQEHTWTAFEYVETHGCEQARRCDRCRAVESRLVHVWGLALCRYGATLPPVPHLPSLWRGGTHPLPTTHRLMVRRAPITSSQAPRNPKKAMRSA